MPCILITDASKPSLVMSSEVFKDKIPGAMILVAVSGKQCLELLAVEKPDMCVVDFDLPDTDGVTLIHAMRRVFRGPILLTAYPDKVVSEAVTSNLFAFNDSGGWIPKPVKFEALSAKIDQFLLDKHRLGRRFDVDMETMIIGKGAGRGKRAPKVSGRITNLSLGGACVELDEPMKMKGGEEMTVSLALPVDAPAAPASIVVKANKLQQPVPKKSVAVLKSARPVALDESSGAEARIKCTIAWIDKNKTKAGLMFAKLTDIQRKGLETLLRESLPGDA